MILRDGACRECRGCVGLYEMRWIFDDGVDLCCICRYAG